MRLNRPSFPLFLGVLLVLQNAGAMLSVSTPVPHELFGGTVAVLSTGESVLVSPTLIVKHTLVSTMLGGAGAALSGIVLSKLLVKVFDVCFIVNCLLGYVSSIARWSLCRPRFGVPQALCHMKHQARCHEA